MKHFSLLFFCVSLLFSACTVPTYYQTYKAVPVSESVENTANALVFENSDCKISYNFWGEGGDVGFSFYNKTDKAIILQKDRCFFVLNGMAFDYFQSRTYSASTSVASATGTTQMRQVPYQYTPTVSSTSAAFGTSSGFSVQKSELSQIVIPAKSSKNLSEFTVASSLYRDCDLLKYPTRRDVQTKRFEASNSPYVFENRICYSFDGQLVPTELTHKFYVSEITNYPENMFSETEAETFCDEIQSERRIVFTAYSPDKFYYKYNSFAGIGRH